MTNKLTKVQLSMLRDIDNVPGKRLPLDLFSHFTTTAKNVVDRLFAAGLLGYVGRYNDIVLTDLGRAALRPCPSVNGNDAGESERAE